MKILITGGAGFIGANITTRLLSLGHEVVVLDNLSRRGAEANLKWIREHAESREFHFEQADIREPDAIEAVFKRHGGIDAVIHQAAQVAVTTSVTEPREDFEVNALGTFNMLEAARRQSSPPSFLFASTNKVYGGMEDVAVEQRNGRYQYRDLPFGVPESQPMDFHSPYGCSKGAADQYVHDYARIYGLKTVVFRQSCIYGPRQFGIEDQGWVAWFIIAALLKQPLTVYGDGKQVRDVLYVDDLVDVYLAALNNIDKAAGKIYNIGGGAGNQLSLLELLDLLRELTGEDVPVASDDWRPGDQPVFVCDVRKAEAELGWKPNVAVADGVARLFDWVSQNRNLIKTELAG